MLQRASAQEMTTDDFIGLQLPPLDSLFEGARKSSMVEFYNYRMEGQELTLKTERKRWLEYFSLSATYSYGVMGMNSYTDIGSNYPIVYQNSGGDQLWYNAGVSVRIPLDNVFDRRNRIKTQQLKIQETLKERDMWYDEQRMKIIERYSKAQEILNYLKPMVEQSTLSDAQYEIAQKDFIVGAITTQSLNTAKGIQVQAFMQMEKVKAELNTVLLQLEILSKTKIINK